MVATTVAGLCISRVTDGNVSAQHDLIQLFIWVFLGEITARAARQIASPSNCLVFHHSIIEHCAFKNCSK